MNVRKIIFLLMSTILVFRSFDVWGGCNGSGDFLKTDDGTYSCDDSSADRQYSNGYIIFVMGELTCYSSSDMHDSDAEGAVKNTFLQCMEGSNDHFKELNDRMYLGGDLGGFFEWDTGSSKSFELIPGATYSYRTPLNKDRGCKGGTKDWECCHGGAVVGCIEKSIDASVYDDRVAVRCKDDLIYHDGECQRYDDIKGSCETPTRYIGGDAAKSIRAADPWTLHAYTAHLYDAPNNEINKPDADRVLKIEGGNEGTALICRLRLDKYMDSDFTVYCTSSNDPIQHETEMWLFECDKNDGWVKKALPWCNDPVNIDSNHKDKVLTGLSEQKEPSCVNRGVGCRAGFSGSDCAYLYCSGDSQPDLEKKKCLTSEDYGRLTQEQKERVDEEVRRSIGDCKNMRTAYEKDVLACENSGGTDGFDWNGPDKQILETVTVDGVQGLTGDYIVKTGEEYWDTAAGAMTTKNKLNCSYETNCVCDAGKKMQAETNKTKCMCIEEHAWIDRADKTKGCTKIDAKKVKADCANIIRYKGCDPDLKPDPCIRQRGEDSCECVSDKYDGYYRLDFNTFECVADSTLAICLPLITKGHAEWENGECKCKDRGSGENIRQYHLINGECLETSESVADRNRRNAAERLDAMIDADERANNAFNRGVSNIQEGSKQIVVDAYDKLNNLQEEADLKQSVWRNKDGKFNTMRLLSDSVAGVALGTVGGVWVHEVLRKNQIESGFEAIGCTVGGETVADFGSVFQIGFK